MPDAHAKIKVVERLGTKIGYTGQDFHFYSDKIMKYMK